MKMKKRQMAVCEMSSVSFPIVNDVDRLIDKYAEHRTYLDHKEHHAGEDAESLAAVPVAAAADAWASSSWGTVVPYSKRASSAGEERPPSLLLLLLLLRSEEEAAAVVVVVSASTP
jgi:hypothetical protein